MKFLILSISLSLFLRTSVPESVYDFTMNNIDGEPVALSNYQGKVLLIVNTASRCGLTPQYKDLQTLYEQYQKQGLEILGFPANNFMAQEPGSDAKIKQFCTNKYQVSFPMFSKISVKGKNIHPLYAYLTKKEQNGVLDAPVAWNFQKFLINRQGKVIKSFSPRDKVTDNKILKTIKKALKKQ